MKNLVAIPILALALMLQSAIISRVTLLTGSADLLLLILVSWALQERVETSWHWAILGSLMVVFVSGLPPLVPFLGYLLAVTLARFIIRQIWQTPLLALFSVTFFGTLIYHLLSYVALRFVGTNLSFGDVLALVTLPSVFLNFLLAIPVHFLIRDLAQWVYPAEELV
jgi:cell shape-determining protein MreD